MGRETVHYNRYSNLIMAQSPTQSAPMSTTVHCQFNTSWKSRTRSCTHADWI